MQLLGLGVLAAILGVFVLGPVIARPAMHVLGFPTKVSGATGHLARENAKRNPRRSAATASALMIGVALVGFITILASSTKASTARRSTLPPGRLRRRLRRDRATAASARRSRRSSPPSPRSSHVSRSATVPATVDGGSSEVTAFDTPTIEDLVDVGVTAGAIEDVHGDGMALSTDRADRARRGPRRHRHGGLLGHRRRRAHRAGPVRQRPARPPAAMATIVDLDTFEANVTDVFDQQVYVTTDDGVDAATSKAAIEGVLEAWPNAELQDQAGFKESVTAEIDMMLNLIYGLLALAVIIALIGIANTLALSVHERTRELGLLRAVGMTRRQLRTAIRWESVLISLLGTALGFGLGVGGAWGITQALADDGVTMFVVPGAQLTVIVGLAVFAGVLAALGPARRAARLNVLDGDRHGLSCPAPITRAPGETLRGPARVGAAGPSVG